MGDGKATQEEQIYDVTEAELVTEAPEDGVEDDVSGVLEIVEEGARALIEAVSAGPADETGVAKGGRARRFPVSSELQCGQAMAGSSVVSPSLHLAPWNLTHPVAHGLAEGGWELRQQLVEDVAAVDFGTPDIPIKRGVEIDDGGEQKNLALETLQPRCSAAR